MATMTLKIASEIHQLILVERETGVKGYGRVWNRVGDSIAWNPHGPVFPLVFGSAGLIAADRKLEGDHKTPEGLHRLRRLFHRGSRPHVPHFPCVEILKDDKWIDDPEHPDYNRWVRGSTTARSYEHLWRDDGLYDFVLELGYNDSPPRARKGSAIFFHVWRGGDRGTEGCLATDRAAMLDLIARLDSAKAPAILIP